MHKFLDIARREAYAHEYEDDLVFHLCAVLVKGGRILSVGFNRRTPNGLSLHHCTRLNLCLETTHAEVDAILRARANHDLNGAKIFVVRIRSKGSHHGTFGKARPCKLCQKILADYGIKRAIYTIDDDTFGVMNVKNLSDRLHRKHN